MGDVFFDEKHKGAESLGDALNGAQSLLESNSLNPQEFPATVVSNDKTASDIKHDLELTLAKLQSTEWQITEPSNRWAVSGLRPDMKYKGTTPNGEPWDVRVEYSGYGYKYVFASNLRAADNSPLTLVVVHEQDRTIRQVSYSNSDTQRTKGEPTINMDILTIKMAAPQPELTTA